MSTKVIQSTKSAQRARGRTLPALASGGALVIAVCMLGAAAAGVFTVQQIDVVGASEYQPVVAQASGVEGQNIFTVQSDAVARRLSGVGQVVVQRVETSFPDRVVVYARPRIPAVALRVGPFLYEVDANATVIRQVSSTALPLVELAPAQDAGGNSPLRLTPGRPSPELTPGIIVAVRYALTAEKRAPSGTIAGFRLSPRKGLTAVGLAGWRAFIGIGSAQKLVDRIATLVSTLRALGLRAAQLSIVDLRNSGPYTRFKQ